MTPWQQGRAAYGRGDDFCPYKDFTWQARDWWEGYGYAEEDDGYEIVVWCV